MSPFDLRGPEFLVFYVFLSAAVLGSAALLQRWLESGPVPRLGDVDPYLVAYLRAGEAEAIRVATLSLLDRGLLKLEGTRLVAEDGAVERVRRPLERALLEACAVRQEPPVLLAKPGPLAACQKLAGELRAHRLLPDVGQSAVRAGLVVACFAVLWGVALQKVLVAIARGHHNLTFLTFLAIALPFGSLFALSAHRTPVGTRVLEDLRELFGRLRYRAAEIRPGGATNELALLVGVYGLDVLQHTKFAGTSTILAMQPPRKDAHRSDSGCGAASCGSSSSCGSSCGGGGGGCGGCGG